jgi:hypothetical protein
MARAAIGHGPLRGALVALLAALALPLAAAEQQTVCTVTVNSADEKETLRRHLPPSKYRFVELVERGRPDWLSSACRASVSCDVLVVSGHFDGIGQFFSDKLDVREYLPVAELERVSCSGSCPSLFSRLKEVYLFGCDSLNPQPQNSASAEIVRSLVREGHPQAEARRRLQAMTAAHGESSRNRMRQIFKGVPAIYGFSSVAPLGPVAASTLDRYLRSGGTQEIGGRRPSSRLLQFFSPHGMSVAQGMGDADPQSEARRDMCRFADDRASDAAKLTFVHQLLQRHIGETRIYLDRIQAVMNGLDGPTRQAPEVARALDTIAHDTGARDRFLGYARAADEPPVRVRMLNLARDVRWLTETERRDEIARLFGELQARDRIGVPEVNLACGLNQDDALDGAYDRGAAAAGRADGVAHAALRACLGSDDGRARTLLGLTSPNEAEVSIAQAYLRHRPIEDAAELRKVAAGIARMPASAAQVRALETLGRHYVADREVLEALTRLFEHTPSPAIQAAVAGILIRADLRAITSPQLVRTLIEKRRAAPGDTIVDALVRRLQQS